MISLRILTSDALAAFLFCLHNSKQDMQHLATLRITPQPMDIEFVGMADYVSE